MALRRFRRHRLAVLALVFLLALVAISLLEPLLLGDRYTHLGFTPLAGPSRGHLMGTDALGRDLLVRVLHGTRLALLIGFGSQLVAVGIGVTVGVIAGFAGGRIEGALMRATDIMFALPALLVALLLITLLGQTVAALTIALGLASWPILSRLVRAVTLEIKEQEFVEAAHAIGASPRRVLRVHILPHTVSPVVVQASFGVAQAMYYEAFLSFIGLGVQPPTPSWGRLIVEGFGYIRIKPHLVLFPTLALSLTLIALNLLGDGLRDALDPRS